MAYFFPPDSGASWQATEPLPLHHSWALLAGGQHFDLGLSIDTGERALRIPALEEEEFARRGIGTWSCALADNSLTWSPRVYEIFGWQDATRISRADTVRAYSEQSRAAMERLRAYAIRHQRGFTLDAEIHPVNGGSRWMRLIAAPILTAHRVTHLHGLKLDVTHEYA